MKLVIHCGLHKTASTSFQEFCAANRDLLRKNGVLYPDYNGMNQHSYVLHDALQAGMEPLGAFLADTRADAAKDCHTVLLSGEDFENCVVDLALTAQIEALAKDAGFDEIEWAAVSRPVEEAVASLYAQLSKHVIVLTRETMQKAARERGCFYASTDDFNYIFVLDFAQFAQQFRDRVAGRVVHYDFRDFLKGYPGMVLLQRLLPGDAYNRFACAARFDNPHANPRLSEWKVETNYIETALGLRRFRYRRLLRPLLAPFVWYRVYQSRNAGKQDQIQHC